MERGPSQWVCTGCYNAVYCNATCQQQDWHAHAAACEKRVMGPWLPSTFTLKVRQKQAGDLFYKKGSHLGYTIGDQEKRPNALCLRANHVYNIVLDPSVVNHPVFIGTTPMGGPTERDNRIVPQKRLGVERGTWVLNTGELTRATSLWLCCANHAYMGFPIEIVQHIETHRCPHNHYKPGDRYYADNIEIATLNNKETLNIVYEEPLPNARLQVAFSSIDTEIPWETHKRVTQFIRVESGYGYIDMHPEYVPEQLVRKPLGPGEAVIIPAETAHRIVKSPQSARPLKLYVLYAKDSTDPVWIH